MALIIEGKMPDTCLSEVSSELHCPIFESCLAFHNAYHHRFEPLENAHKCRLEDCPIIGEIPDKHGDLIDRDELLTDLADRMCVDDMLDGIYQPAIDRINEAKAVLEAST